MSAVSTFCHTDCEPLFFIRMDRAIRGCSLLMCCWLPTVTFMMLLLPRNFEPVRSSVQLLLITLPSLEFLFILPLSSISLGWVNLQMGFLLPFCAREKFLRDYFFRRMDARAHLILHGRRREHPLIKEMLPSFVRSSLAFLRSQRNSRCHSVSR